MTPGTDRYRVLLVVGAAELFAMSSWFSATAVAPSLAGRWGLSSAETAWLTTAVQLGFVVGALMSAGLTLSDVVPTRYLFAASAVVAAGATALLPVVPFPVAVGLRALTGVALAGVYPPGMKLVAGWFEGGRGFAVGSLVGALAVGSALPHLLRFVGGVGRPDLVLFGSALLTLLGGVLVLRVEAGPYGAPPAPFDPAAVRRVLRDRPTLLADFGYFGHMWELYAVWTWLPVFLVASLAAAGRDGELASLLAFGAIAVGGVGSLLAGLVADRVGRTTLTSASMVASGSACLLAGVVFGASPAVVAAFVLLWGVVVLADSAQFSAAVTELAEPAYVGTALTLQTAVGFLLTVVSIQLVPVVAGVVGWQWAFAPLAAGPLVGTLAMLRLRALPAARRLAGGHR